MTNQMSQFKETANAHMRAAIESGGKWVCDCEPCQQIRSLVGLEKTLNVRPLVREIQEVESRLDGLLEGPEKRALRQQYLRLCDELADVVAR